MKCFTKICLFTMVSIVMLFSGCKNKPTKEYFLTSGTGFDSKDGFTMKVKIFGDKNQKAEIETKYMSEMPNKQNVLNNFGELNIKEILFNDSIKVNIDSFKNVVVHKIRIPSDGKNYWYVFFDPKQPPTLANRISGGGGSDAIGCCCGAAGDGCYVSESGSCLTKVCNACTNAMVKLDNENIATLVTYNKGFSLIQADTIVFNGKKIDYPTK